MSLFVCHVCCNRKTNSRAVPFSMFAIGFAFFGNTVDAGKNNSTVQPTLLGPQSRFGDKLFGI